MGYWTSEADGPGMVWVDSPHSSEPSSNSSGWSDPFANTLGGSSDGSDVKGTNLSQVGPEMSFGDSGGILPALVLGGLSFAGQMSANSANRDIADAATASNAAEAQKNRDFQERMSNSSYQRGMADMKAAGLNPLLAFSQGGASTPSGSTGSAATAHMENALAPAVNSAVQGLQLHTALEQTQSQTSLNRAIEKTNQTQQLKNVADATTSARQAEKLASENSLLKKNIPRAEAQNKLEGWLLDKANKFINSNGKEALDNANRAIENGKRVIP